MVERQQDAIKDVDEKPNLEKEQKKDGSIQAEQADTTPGQELQDSQETNSNSDTPESLPVVGETPGQTPDGSYKTDSGS